MRIAFVGKGGSGKSTLCGAFIHHLSKTQNVLAIDADVNRHLPAILGFDQQPKSLALDEESIYDYLKGSRTDIEKFVSTTPPSADSVMIKPDSSDPFIKNYALSSNDKRIHLLSVGRYEKEDVGDSCYHGKLYTLAAILHHTIDQQDNWIVADSTAGTDGLATSLFYAYDAYVYVVEPTLKSIKVYKDFVEATEETKPIFVVINKADEQDMDFVHQYIKPNDILAVVPHSNEMRRHDQGDESAFDRFVTASTTQMQNIEKTLSKLKRDHNAYYKQLVTLHNDLAQSWGNTYYQANLEFLPSDHYDFEENFLSDKSKAA